MINYLNIGWMVLLMEILYLTYDGLLDPLGQSQILPYILGLQKKGCSFHLISFEKKQNLYGKEISKLKSLLQQKNIYWYPLLYHKRLSLLSKWFDVFRGIQQSKKILNTCPISIVHARSYVAGLMAWKVTKQYPLKFLFDMRGFWPEERVEGNIWSEHSPLFRLAKHYEKKFFQASDAIVVLTHAAKHILEQQYRIKKPIAVIPTCADTSMFKPRKREGILMKKLRLQGKFVLAYVGSLGTWYCFEEMVKFFLVLKKEKPSAHFLLLVNDLEKAKTLLEKVPLAKEEYTLSTIPRVEMPRWLSLADAGVFFIQPVFSKKGSCPTKFGEFLAAGIPIIANKGIGDCDRYIGTYRVGIVVDGFTAEAYRKAVSRIRELSGEDGEGIRQRCRNLALLSFSLDTAVSAYLGMYAQIGTRKRNVK